MLQGHHVEDYNYIPCTKRKSLMNEIHSIVSHRICICSTFLRIFVPPQSSLHVSYLLILLVQRAPIGLTCISSLSSDWAAWPNRGHGKLLFVFFKFSSELETVTCLWSRMLCVHLPISKSLETCSSHFITLYSMDRQRTLEELPQDINTDIRYFCSTKC